jgi:hypothetical protein
MILFSSGCLHITSPWPRGLHAQLGIERSGVQIPVKATHFFLNCLSQINIELNISVAISLIANLLKYFGGTIQKQIGLKSHNLHLSDILRPKQIQCLLYFDSISVNIAALFILFPMENCCV